jgi:transglutaminase-like putative cysteine protease
MSAVKNNMRDVLVKIVAILKEIGHRVGSFVSHLPWGEIRDSVMRLDPKRRKQLLVIAGICMIIIAAFVFRAIITRASYPIPRYIRYSYTVKNMTNHVAKEVHFWTYAPVKKTPTQKCIDLKASDPYKLITDDLGNQILHFTLNDIPPYASKIISIETNLKLADKKPNRFSLRGKKTYLKAEEYCEADDPAIIQQAKQLRGAETTKTAENIFRWVSNTVQYTGYIENPRGALYALKEKKGDCTEFMYLFVALSRANKIPARNIGGYVVTDNAVLRPTAYHNWAEFYDEGTWRIADPQRKVFMQNQSRYIAMHVIGESPKNPIGVAYRFKYEGQGIKVRMNK